MSGKILRMSEAMYEEARRHDAFDAEKIVDALVDVVEERVRTAIERATTESIEESNIGARRASEKGELEDQVWENGNGHGKLNGIESLAGHLGVDYDEPRLEMPYVGKLERKEP